MSPSYSLGLRAALVAKNWDAVITTLTDLDSLEKSCRADLAQLFNDLAFVLRKAPMPLPPEAFVLHASGARLDRTTLALIETTLDAKRHQLEEAPEQLFPVLYNQLYWRDAPERAEHHDGPLPRSEQQIWRLMEHWRSIFEARSNGWWLRSLRPPGSACGDLLGWRVPGGSPVLNPDGTLLLVQSQREHQLFDAKAGVLRQSLMKTAYGSGALFSPKGDRFVVFSGEGAQLWATETLTQLRSFESRSEEFRHAAFSEDGEVLLLASLNKIRAWRLKDQTCIATYQPGDEIQKLLIRGRGRVVLHCHKSWKLWAYEEQKVLASGQVQYYLPEVAVSADGTRLATLTGNGVMECLSLPEMKSVFLKKCPGNGLAFHPDGSVIAASNWSGAAAIIYDAVTGEEKHTVPGGNSWGLSFSPTGRFLIAWSNNVSRLWDVEQNAMAAMPSSGNSVGNGGGASWSREGRVVAISDGSTTLISDLSTLSPTPAWRDDTPPAWWQKHFSPSGATVVVSHRDQASFWSTKRGVRLRLVPNEDMRIFFDGQRVLCQQKDAWVAFAIEDGSTLFSLSIPDDEVISAAISDKHGVILGGTKTKQLIAWSSRDGQERYRLVGERESVWDNLFLLRTPEGTLSLREIASGQERISLPKHSGQRFSLSPDERWLAIFQSRSSSSEVEAWDLSTGSKRHTFTATDTNVETVYFDAESKTLTTVTERMMNISDGYNTPTECVFDLSTGTMLKEEVDPQRSIAPKRDELLPGFIVEGGTVATPGGTKLKIPDMFVGKACEGKLFFAGTENERVVLLQLCGPRNNS